MKTLIVDNYDSFTYNLYQLVGKITGTPPIVIRNNELTWKQLLELAPDNIILSPGPGRPENERDFGICRRILLESTVPVFGVCLGLQGMGYVFGGSVVHAPEPMHGRASVVHHDGRQLFAGIPQQFEAVRYHSLTVAQQVPDSLRVTAWTDDNVVMGLEHRERAIWGVQFHPESIGTQYGEQLLRNFPGNGAASNRVSGGEFAAIRSASRKLEDILASPGNLSHFGRHVLRAVRQRVSCILA
jgi:para-aminobenzoate synthetase